MSNQFLENNEVQDQTLQTNEVHTGLEAIAATDNTTSVDRFSFFNSMPQIATYLSREFLLMTGQFSIGDTATNYASLNVLSVWATNKHVRAKLTNFHCFKFKSMKIRITFSASAFHYQQILASYQPLPASNITLAQYASVLASANYTKTSREELFNNYLSQAKHCQVISVRDNATTELEIPYYWQVPYLRLFMNNTNGTGTATVPEDLDKYGQLYLSPLAAIKSSGAASVTPVSFSVRVIMEGIELGPPSQYQLQSGEGEFAKGPISKGATALANVSASLEPVFGKFAKATTIGASAIAHIASLFGLSRPLNLDKWHHIKVFHFGSDASELSETALPLALDPKRELSLDLGVTNAEQDDMLFENLGNRLTYIHTVPWTSAATAQTELNTFKCGLIATYAAAFGASGVPDLFAPTPAAFIGRFFKYYRYDTMEVNLVLASSQFHAGKIAIRIQPAIGINTALFSENYDIMSQAGIEWDIKQSTCLTFDVPWLSPNAFLEIEQNAYRDYDTISSLAAKYVPAWIQLKVINTLVDPESVGVDINVFVKYKGLKFFKPNDAALRRSSKITASLFAVSETYSLQSGIPSFSAPLKVLPTQNIDSSLYLNYGGEQIASVKQLCSRYTMIDYVQMSGAVASKLYNHTKVIATPYPASSGKPGEYTNIASYRNFMSYWRYCFLAVRGGVRYKVVPHGAMANSSITVKARCLNNYNADAVALTDITNTKLMINRAGTNDLDWIGSTSTLTGGQTFTGASGTEIEIPFYGNILYEIGFQGSAASPADYLGGESASVALVTTFFDADPVAVNLSNIEYMTAGATDFMFQWYQGAPLYSATNYVWT